MRHIVIDSETTGFKKNRVIELAALEFDLQTGVFGRTFHAYFNPEGEQVEPGAFKVHGLSNAFLKNKPLFKTSAADFCNFISGAHVYAHNAPFDTRVLNAELELLQLPPLDEVATKVICTLAAAKKLKLPTENSKLDTLCDHYQVDRSARSSHGALIDCQLLARVYIAMQPDLVAYTPPVTASRAVDPNVKSEDKPRREGWRPGGPWHDDERASLEALHLAGIPLDDICTKHNRSFVSIVMQMVKQGLLTQDACDQLRAARTVVQASISP